MTGVDIELYDLEDQIKGLIVARMNVYKTTQELIAKYEIKNLPEIRLYMKGDEIGVFEGIIKNEFLREWILKKLEPLVKTIDSLDELEAFENNHDLIILVNGRDNQEFIERISRRLDGVFFLITENQEIIKKYQEKVTFFRKFDHENPISKPSLQGLLSFIERYRFPSPMRLSYRSKDWLLSTEDPVLWLFLSNQDEDMEILESFERFAKENKENLAFVVEDGSFKDPFFEISVEKMGVSKAERPCIRLTR